MNQVENIKLSLIRANPYQPRFDFDNEAICELAASINENGLIQPIILRKAARGYQIVAGERRYRAYKLLEKEEIPAIVIEADEHEMARLALIENLQREDLSPIEEASAYKQLIENENLTQEQLADRLGKTQSSVANKLRLLNLSRKVQQALLNKTITERHGRAMLSLDEKQQNRVLKKIVAKGYNVADTERYIETHFSKPEEEEEEVLPAGSIRCFGVSTKIALNTVRKAVRSLKNIDVPVSIDEQETDDDYVMTITIKKQ